MKPFTFLRMLLLQRIDSALSIERLKLQPDPLLLASLARHCKRLTRRLAPPMAGMLVAGGG
jgi:hypothetical protein